MASSPAIWASPRPDATKEENHADIDDHSHVTRYRISRRQPLRSHRTGHAEGTTSVEKAPGANTTKSLTESVGNLTTDTSKTTKDTQALEVQKTIQGAGQVKQDAKDVKDSATETLKNPLGTMGK
ncbi:hypothetical protein [Petrachloros mirabilis]